MNPNVINSILYRPVNKETKYNNLFPSSNCEKVKLAQGNTKVAIDNMALWILKNQNQTLQLYNKYFKNYNLKELCKKVHSFSYNNIQYKIDEYDQNLRSPACTWQSRVTGVDCKSFSIIVGSIILNARFSFFLRRIIQNKGEGYSHVYVIVPKDQKTYNLKNGYYAIDGTLKNFEEPVYYKSDDVFVQGKVKALNGAGAVAVQVLGESAKKLVSYATNELIKELNSCNSSKYNIEIVKLKIVRDLQAKLQTKLDDLSDAILFEIRPRIQYLFNDIFKELDLGIAHLRNEKAFYSNESCEFEVLSKALDFGEKIKKFIDNFYNDFKKKYPNYQIEEFKKDSRTSDRTLYFVVDNSANVIVAPYRFIILRKTASKYGIEPIFPYQENSNRWLNKNVEHLKNNYKDNRSLNYITEVKPILNKIKNLRAKIDIGGEMLYYYEKPLQRKMYKIWLKYDTKYTVFLKKEAKSIRTANELALRDYENRFKQTISEDKKAKMRKKIKKNIGSLFLISSAMIIFFKQ